MQQKAQRTKREKLRERSPEQEYLNVRGKLGRRRGHPFIGQGEVRGGRRDLTWDADGTQFVRG
jgi:hypothetical protein